MWRHGKKHIIAGMFAAVTLGAAGTIPAAAQSIPVIPPIGPGVTGCASLASLPGCNNTVIHMPSAVVVIVPGGDYRGGPLHENGGRDVDVDRNTHNGRAVVR